MSGAECIGAGGRRGRLAVYLAILLGCAVFAAGCGARPAIGDIDDRATVSLIRFEQQEDGIDGVVYRRINRFEMFLAQSDVPVLVVFYEPMAAVNTQVIPMLEQMADDYRDRLAIAWIDASAEEAIAGSFQVEILPQFTIVVEASLKRSLAGFDDEGQARVAELLAPYLSDS